MEPRARAGLSALADKYREIARMRAAAASTDATLARVQMASLAARFPGALRELDELPDAIIVERLACIDQALQDQQPARWMLLQVGYHGVMRAALRVRRLLREHVGPATRQALEARGYVGADDEPALADWGEPELSAVLRPPGGRLNPWVFGQVGRAHGADADEVRRALFLR